MKIIKLHNPEKLSFKILKEENVLTDYLNWDSIQSFDEFKSTHKINFSSNDFCLLADEEIFDLGSLVKNFDIRRVQKKSATFDQKKFNWISSQHLMKEDSVKVFNRLASIDPEWGKPKRQDYLIKVIDLMKPSSNSLTDLINQSRYFFSSPKEFDSTQLQKFWKQDTTETLIELESILGAMNSWVATELDYNFKSFMDQRGLGFGKVMKPMRFLICGSLQGPSLFDLMELIGKEESLKRINYAINEF